MLIRPQSIPSAPSFEHERGLLAKGFSRIAGIDEVGRGPLAGPVLAAAVVLDEERAGRLSGTVTDSKQMSEQERDAAVELMERLGVEHGLGACSAAEIDSIGIVAATRLAMARAIESLEQPADHLLVDAVRLELLRTPQTAIIKGDAVSISIAAASVFAKVTRDRLMSGVLDRRFPGYGFASHKGYGTALHLEALRRNGPCEIHRSTFRPVSDALREAARQ